MFAPHIGRGTRANAGGNLGERNVGLDGVIAQQANYRKSGFRLAYRNIRYQGRVDGIGCAHVAAAAVVPFEQLLAYDRRCFPAARERFVSAWIAQPDAVALATVDSGRVPGYGVVRRCKVCSKIGPLFADDAGVATGLFRALAASMPGEVIVLDVPETNPAAVALAVRHCMPWRASSKPRGSTRKTRPRLRPIACLG